MVGVGLEIEVGVKVGVNVLVALGAMVVVTGPSSAVSVAVIVRPVTGLGNRGGGRTAMNSHIAIPMRTSPPTNEAILSRRDIWAITT